MYTIGVYDPREKPLPSQRPIRAYHPPLPLSSSSSSSSFSWLSCLSSRVVVRLQSRVWVLLDADSFPPKEVSLPKGEEEEGGTLQANGFWPSKNVLVRAREEFEMKGDE